MMLDAKADIEARRADMSTPLIVASVFAHAEVVAALLEAGALLLPSDEDGTALDNARRNKKGGECVALLEAAMKLRGHLEQVGALATSRYISPYLHESHLISLHLTIAHFSLHLRIS